MTSSEIVQIENPLATLDELDRAGEQIAHGARSAATWRAYQSDWHGFRDWCEDHDETAMPASPETVGRYMVDMARQGLRPSTIARHLASISVVHSIRTKPSPCKSPLVRDRMAGIRRLVGTSQDVATPILIEDLRAMIAATPVGDVDRYGRPKLHGLRDRALLLVGFAAALRRSEIAGLNLVDVREVRAGMEITIQRSKTDQQGEGAVVPVPFGSREETCPVRNLTRWIDVVDQAPSAGEQFVLFPAISPDGWVLGRMTGQAVSQVVARAARRADLDPNGSWTGHSLRAGLATSAARAGVSDRVIMATTRHRSRTTLDRYIREGKRWDDVAAASVGL